MSMKCLTTFMLIGISWIASAQESCPAPLDTDQDGLIGINDMLNILSVFGDSDMDFDGIWDSVDDCIGTYDECGVCNGQGIASGACNCDGDVVDAVDVCGGLCLEDFDGDGVCDLIDCGNPVAYQGYYYGTVAIGNQCWFAENLRSLSYRNGDIIPSNLNDNDWINATSGATAIYGEGASSCDDDSPAGNACDETWMLNLSGRLYNGYAVLDNRQLCPNGWQVPSQSDFIELGNFLGGSESAGNELKSSFGWYSNGNGSNSVGFDGRPGGFRVHSNGRFQNGGSSGYFWSTTLNSNELMEGSRLLWNSEELDNSSTSTPVTGRSVRCIKE